VLTISQKLIFFRNWNEKLQVLVFILSFKGIIQSLKTVDNVIAKPERSPLTPIKIKIGQQVKKF
jgi:hypothetical protein